MQKRLCLAFTLLSALFSTVVVAEPDPVAAAVVVNDSVDGVPAAAPKTAAPAAADAVPASTAADAGVAEAVVAGSHVAEPDPVAPVIAETKPVVTEPVAEQAADMASVPEPSVAAEADSSATVAAAERSADNAPEVEVVAESAAADSVVAEAEGAAPIVEPPPPQRAENVDLREVVTEKVTPPPVVVPEPASTPAAATEAMPAPVDEVVPEGTPLILLGTEVPPSTAARLAWSPSESFAGIDAPTPVLVVNGAKPGPVLCLTAAIHGDELVGIEVVRRVLYSVDARQLSGALIGVPIVNLQGFRRGSRYLPDRRDLNRYFPGNTYGSSASRIAYSFFNQVVSKCDLLVDLHTGSFHRTNMPQVRGDLQNPDVAALTKGFGGTVILHGPGARGMLRRAAVEAGIPAVTLEAGEPLRLDDGPVEHGVRSIESLLENLGMLKARSLWSRREQPVFYKSTWVRANEGGVLSSKVRLGQRIKVGDLLGTVIDPITNAQHDIISPYAGRIIGMAVNQVMMPGFAAYHVGIQATVEEAAEPDPTLDTAIDELDDEDAEPMPEAPAQSGEQSGAQSGAASAPVEEASTGE